MVHNQNFCFFFISIRVIKTDINAPIEINNHTGKTQLNLFNSLSMFNGFIHIKSWQDFHIKLSPNNKNIQIGMILSHIE